MDSIICVFVHPITPLRRIVFVTGMDVNKDLLTISRHYPKRLSVPKYIYFQQPHHNYNPRYSEMQEQSPSSLKEQLITEDLISTAPTETTGFNWFCLYIVSIMAAIVTLSIDNECFFTRIACFAPSRYYSRFFIAFSSFVWDINNQNTYGVCPSTF